MRIAVYAGSFDPVTNGHLDVIDKARALANVVHVVVGLNPDKQAWFSAEERVSLLRSCVPSGVVVASTEGLIVDYARSVGARWLVRGVRSVTDAESELRLSGLNATLAPEITTLFINADPDKAEVSSSRLKQLAQTSADVSAWCPASVERVLRTRTTTGAPGSGGPIGRPTNG